MLAKLLFKKIKRRKERRRKEQKEEGDKGRWAREKKRVKMERQKELVRKEAESEKQRESQNMEASIQSLLFCRARKILEAPPQLLSYTEIVAQPLITIPRSEMWASHLKTSTWFFTK